MKPFNKQSNVKPSHTITTPLTMYYDDTCVICSTEAKTLQSRNPTGIRLIAVDVGIDELNKAGFSREDAMTYLCVQDGAGQWHTHMEAVRQLYKTAGFKYANWLYLPIIKQVGDFVYPFVARNRYRFPDWLVVMLYGEAVKNQCQDGVCKLPVSERIKIND